MVLGVNMNKLLTIILATLVVVIVAISGYYWSVNEKQAESGDETIKVSLLQYR